MQQAPSGQVFWVFERLDALLLSQNESGCITTQSGLMMLATTFRAPLLRSHTVLQPFTPSKSCLMHTT